MPVIIRLSSTFSRRRHHWMYIFARSCRFSADSTESPHTCGWNRFYDTKTCCGETYPGSYTRVYRGGSYAPEDQLGSYRAAHCAATGMGDNRHICLSKNWPVVLDPRPQLYDKRQVSLTNCLADVQANRPFAIRVANFGASEWTLAKNQVLGFR